MRPADPSGRFIVAALLLVVILIGASVGAWSLYNYGCQITDCSPASGEPDRDGASSPSPEENSRIGNVRRGLWLCLVSAAIILIPRVFVWLRFQSESGNSPEDKNFKAFQSIDYVWRLVAVCCLGLSLFVFDLSHIFTLLVLFMAAASMPAALYSGLTGIYLDRSRWRCYYFRQYKDPARRLLMPSRVPELKIVGWGQLIFLSGLAGISAGWLVGW